MGAHHRRRHGGLPRHPRGAAPRPLVGGTAGFGTDGATARDGQPAPDGTRRVPGAPAGAGTPARVGRRSSEAPAWARSTRLVLTLLIVLGLSTVISEGTHAALSGSTDNTGNTFSAGTVVLGDNDAGNALLNVTNARPGVPASQCIQLRYTGSLTASVRMYGTMTGALTPYVKLTVTRATIRPPRSPVAARSSPTRPTTPVSAPGCSIPERWQPFPAATR